MLNVEETEASCVQAKTIAEEAVLPPALIFQRRFYPLGFALDVRTNSEEVLGHYEEHWGKFEARFDAAPLLADVHVVEGPSDECPPRPEHRFLNPIHTIVADANNYCIADISRNHTRMVISRAALQQHPLYIRYFFLESAVGTHIATCYATPVHASCVTLDGRGVLLCGDSGAGKSTLSFACARSGWGYVTDDASFLLQNGSGRRVIGNCHEVRLRPTAVELFPEIADLPLTPRAEGKPSIEISTVPMPIVRQETAEIDFVVFLNRGDAKNSGLFPYSREVARQNMRQVLFGTAETLARQRATIDRLLEARVVELRYQSLEEAEELLRRLVREER